MTKIKDNCILITGGASGIGHIMGRMALEKGARHLIIWDINEENLNATRNELAPLGKVACYKVNIADHAAVEHNKRFKGLPFSFHFIRLCQALLPSSWFDVIVGHWLGIYSTMDHFTGRK